MKGLSAALAGIEIDAAGRKSIAYVKARCAIEAMAKSRADKRLCKQAVIEHLGGRIRHLPAKRGQEHHNVVVFPDNSKARY